MDEQYYKDYYILERRHWWFQVRANILKNILDNWSESPGHMNILNVGAATGGNNQMLETLGTVTSVEYERGCCNILEQEGYTVYHASILDLPFEDEKFDLVCAFDVIEHVDDDYKAVAELYRVCNNKGLVFITVPAYMFLWSKHDEINHHYRRYTLKSLKALLADFNFEILYKSYFNTFLFLPIALFRVLSKPFEKSGNKQNKGSDFSVTQNESFINRVFYALFNSERKLLKKGISFPFGVSVCMLARKL